MAGEKPVNGDSPRASLYPTTTTTTAAPAYKRNTKGLGCQHGPMPADARCWQRSGLPPIRL